MNERIKALRKKLKMSQDIFAEKLGLTKNYISLIENGNRSLSRQSIKVLCSMFNVNEDWLQNGTGNMFKSETYTSYNANQIINGPINERIKELRHTLKLTQQEFADRLGVKRNTVGQWECGINSLTNATIIFLCKEFNVSENWLRNGIGDMFKSKTYTSYNANQIISGSINERIKELRHTLKLTQQEFANRIGSKRNTVAKYETDVNTPSAAVVSLICREFNVSEKWLRTGEGDMFKSETYTSNNANQIISGSINERIKELRHTLKLTQQEFADKIGIKRGAIANYEIGRNTPINSVVSLICREFNVNENWLRNGSGNMFLPKDNSNSDMCIDSTFLKLLSMLDVEQLNYIKGIVLGTLIADGKVTLEDLHNY